MNRQQTKPLGHTMLRTKVERQLKSPAGYLAASATLLALAFSPSLGQAAPSRAPVTSTGVYVTILSPIPGSSFDGSKQVEVSAFYQASLSDGGVTTLELYIDGHKAAAKQLDSPETRGVVSFLIDPNVLTSGRHHIVVRATAGDAEVNSAMTSVSIAGDNDQIGNLGTDLSDTPPQLFITSPSPDSTIAGTVKIDVNAHDDSGKPPYVSLFIDHAFKTLRNYPPFSFDWDTTRVANGYHTIEVYGYNDAQQVGHAQPLRVLVNNPGGRTIVRHDLSDVVSGAARAKTERPADVTSLRAKKLAAKPKAIRRTPLLADAQTGWSAPDLTGNLPLLTDAELAQVAPPSAVGRLDAVAPRAPAKRIAPASPKAVKAGGSLAWTGTRGGSPAFSASQMLASADSNETLAGGLDTQTLLSAPFIHAAPASTNGSALISPDAHSHTAAAPQAARAGSHGTPLLAQPAATGAGDVEMASAGLQPDRLSPQDPFDGAGKLETPDIGRAQGLALPTHRVISAGRIIPVMENGIANPHVLARARGSYRLVMNEQQLTLDRPVQVHGSMLFAPFRQTFESEGGTLLWLPEAKKIQAVSATRQIDLTIGSRDALVNDQSLLLGEAPYLFYGRTMVPLSFLPAALDVSVSFDASTGHLIINSNK